MGSLYGEARVVSEHAVDDFVWALEGRTSWALAPPVSGHRLMVVARQRGKSRVAPWPIVFGEVVLRWKFPLALEVELHADSGAVVGAMRFENVPGRTKTGMRRIVESAVKAMFEDAATVAAARLSSTRRRPKR